MKTERANAKINPYLDVVGVREDGYHNIVSIMQTVSLCDLVTVDFHSDVHTSIHISASGNDQMPTDCRNLAWRAAEKYLQRVQRSGSVQIIIQKNIPMAAGLAGGSADAAAVLRALNHLCGSPLSVEELCKVGVTLGADVPFCICGGSALVEGIGERLSAIPAMPHGYLVVACRGEGVSTPWAYGALDEKYEKCYSQSTATEAVRRITEEWQNQSLLTSCARFYNVFEEVVPAVQGHVEALKQIMRGGGAVQAMMSGSGPSVFGIFEGQEAAFEACARLREAGAAAFVCHPCGKYE